MSLQTTLRTAYSYTTHHTNNNTSIMDSDNNKQHLFNTDIFFPLGYVMKSITITGVNGICTKRVGLGTAFFSTTLDNNKTHYWIVPNSIYDPSCPVNLLCMDLFHYTPSNTKTGYTVDFTVDFINERIQLHTSHIPMPRHPASRLYLVTVTPTSAKRATQLLHSPTRASRKHFLNSFLYTDACDNLVLYKHTELQPMNTQTAMRILNNPLEKYFNTMVEHQMIDGIQRAHSLSNRLIRPTGLTTTGQAR